MASSPRTRSPRTRAVDAEDREVRRTSILDAAEQLFARSPQRDISMSEVAALAGLAKGTIYLYFESKEVLLVALHVRRVDGFFSALTSALRTEPTFGFTQIAAIVRRHLTEDPLYMALGSIAMGLLDKPEVPEPLKRYSEHISIGLLEAGRALEQRLGVSAPGEGLRMLIHGYALIVGLWHLLATPCSASAAACQALGSLDYADEAQRALFRYWSSALERPA